MSSRRNGSVSRAAEAASKNRLHMDRNPQTSRINDPSNPAGRRKELDNVMKRARQASPGSWDRKLLEVEEKDPNRSPLPPRSRSPVRRKSRSPRRSPRRSPIRRTSPAPRRRSARRSPVAAPSVRPARPRPPPPARVRPPSPPGPRKSTSGSSNSSCSDESCSVCSAKNKKGPPQPPKGVKLPPRPASESPQQPRVGARAVQPTRELLKAREGSKRTREEKVLEWQRSQLAHRGTACPVAIPGDQIKREGERHPPTDPRRRRVSPAAIAAALNDTDSDSTDTDDRQPQRLTLSERFGKMAQWSLDRSARLENMLITRRSSTLHVRIERDPPAPPGGPGGAGAAPLEPELPPDGAYPSELPAAPPTGQPSWDDVTVRYEYYKKRGYLRGLSLGDYVKWEEWWYKYQEWLERERAYERWADGEPRPARRDRRRKGGRHRRS